jgi:hypothetical protein
MRLRKSAFGLRRDDGKEETFPRAPAPHHRKGGNAPTLSPKERGRKGVHRYDVLGTNLNATEFMQ